MNNNDYCRCIPILINIPCIAATVKISNQLNALVDLDIKVVKSVLEDMEDMKVLKAQLREKILSKIKDTDESSQRDVRIILFLLLNF